MSGKFFIFADGWRLYVRPLSDARSSASIQLSRPDGVEAGEWMLPVQEVVPRLIDKHGPMRTAKASEI